MPSVYSGDVKLFLTPDGADIRFACGQPVMERGVENIILISLFTREGWAGNIFQTREGQIGSGFEEACAENVTLETLRLTADAAEKALDAAELGAAAAEIVNTAGADIALTVVTPQGNMNLVRTNELWRNQRSA
jgi:hypothetical protein